MFFRRPAEGTPLSPICQQCCCLHYCDERSREFSCQSYWGATVRRQPSPIPGRCFGWPRRKDARDATFLIHLSICQGRISWTFCNPSALYPYMLHYTHLHMKYSCSSSNTCPVFTLSLVHPFKLSPFQPFTLSSVHAFIRGPFHPSILHLITLS